MDGSAVRNLHLFPAELAYLLRYAPMAHLVEPADFLDGFFAFVAGRLHLNSP
jgi:hypothetical protein